MPRKRTVTRRPSYGDAVRWLAANDECAEHRIEDIASFTTTLLAADLFGAEPRALAVDVLRSRHGAGPWPIDPSYRCKCEVNPAEIKSEEE